jgi:hypothetical protein
MPPCAYVFDAEGTQHVDYVGMDGHIHELWWDDDGWHHHDLTNASGAPVSEFASPAAYVVPASRTQHVDFIGADGHIHELKWEQGSWTHGQLTDQVVIPPTSLAAYFFQARGTEHVAYLDSAAHVQELCRDAGGWHQTDLTDATESNPIFGGFVYAYPFEGQATRHVNCVAGAGHVHDFWWNDDGWQYIDLTAITLSPLSDFVAPTGYAFASESTLHVNYIGITDGHIHELWWRHETRWNPGGPVLFK